MTLPAKLNNTDYSVYKLKHMLKPRSFYTYAKPVALDQVDTGYNGVLELFVTERETPCLQWQKIRYRNQ
jgi:signal transduction protein with GAF and PtsI domain